MAAPDDNDVQQNDTVSATERDAQRDSIRKMKEGDFQSLDPRVRRAMMEGDVTYIEGLLGTDRKLSDAELSVLLKTKQEAEERAAEIKAAEDTNAQGLRDEEKKKEEVDGSRYSEEEYALDETRGDGGDAGERSEFPAEPDGWDEYGQAYYSHFGYDTQGNYHDSYGCTLDKEGEYKAPDGSVADLKHGIYTKGNNVFNSQTNEEIIEKDGKYYLMKKNEDGQWEPENKGPDGKPAAMSREEKDAKVAEWKRTNHELSDAEVKQLQQKIATGDENRSEDMGNGKPSGDNKTAPSVPTGTPGGNSTTDPGSPNNPYGNPGQQLKTDGDAAIDAGRVALERSMGFARSNFMSTKETAGRHMNDALDIVAGNTVTQISDEERNRRTSKPRPLANKIPKFTVSTPADPLGDMSTHWVKDKDNGFFDDKGGYYDNRGGYFDAKGGYFDADGGYSDRYGGYMSKDGSYMDAKKNVVDAKGNLWLAGAKASDGPSFPAREGVNWVDVLAAITENRWKDLAGMGVTADEVKQLHEKFDNPAKDSKFAASNVTTTTEPGLKGSSQSNFVAPAGTGASAFASMDSLPEPPATMKLKANVASEQKGKAASPQP